MLLLCVVEESLVSFGVSFGAERSPARAVVLDLVCLVGSPGKVLKLAKSRHELTPISSRSLGAVPSHNHF